MMIVIMEVKFENDKRWEGNTYMRESESGMKRKKKSNARKKIVLMMMMMIAELFDCCVLIFAC